MAWTVSLQPIQLFVCCVCGAHLQYGSTRLYDSPSNVTLTVGATNQRVLCLQATGPMPTSMEWYNPQGLLVSRDNGKEVNQAAGGDRTSTLTFRSYQQSQGGKYECRVAGPGNNTERLAVCIGPTSRLCVWVTPTVQGTSPTLTVTWHALAEEAVTYTVKYSTQPGEVSTPAEGALEVAEIGGTSTILTALERGTTYYIWVVRVSEGREGPNSDRISRVTHDNVPQLVSVSLVPLNEAGKIRVTWSRPTLEPGQVITGYSVQYRRRGTTSYTTRSVSGSSTTSSTITNLNLGAVYEVRVASVGPLGLSGYCCGSGKEVTTYSSVPQPSSGSVSVVALNETGKVRVTWSRRILGSGQMITGYSVQYRRKGTTSYTTRSVSGSSTTSYTITKLNVGTVYEVRVASVGPLGLSGYCCRSGKEVTTYHTPGAVLGLSYEEYTDTSVNITWKPPSKPNGGILAYFVEHGVYNKKSAKDVRVDASRPRYTLIQALEPGVPYNVTVRASTAVGKGEPVSIVVFAVQQAPTAQISNVEFGRFSNNKAAFVSWTPLTLHQARGFPVYFVAYQPTGQTAVSLSNVINTTDSEVLIVNLDPTTEYTFTVDVGTAGGKSSLYAVEAERVNPRNLSSDSSSSTGVGLFLGGVVAGALGVLLTVGIVGGACRLRRSRHRKSSPSGKAASEEVPMEDNPAYGDVNVNDTVTEPEEN